MGDTHQHLPKLKRLRKQFQEESGTGSLFTEVEEFLLELLFSAIESKELETDFGGD